MQLLCVVNAQLLHQSAQCMNKIETAQRVKESRVTFQGMVVYKVSST